ncbi:MAG TPA: hypothetical protein VJR23_08595 [Candidatus Acidoferrales bacterium]|nr:hypothetical protein [Candidatus Acidoferrales bacterium]
MGWVAGHERTVDAIVCEAPDDVTMLEIATLQGQVVTGQPIATLSSMRVKWLENRLTSATAELEIQKRAFTEGRVQDIEAALADNVRAAQANNDVAVRAKASNQVRVYLTKKSAKQQLLKRN